MPNKDSKRRHRHLLFPNAHDVLLPLHEHADWPGNASLATHIHNGGTPLEWLETGGRLLDWTDAGWQCVEHLHKSVRRIAHAAKRNDPGKVSSVAPLLKEQPIQNLKDLVTHYATPIYSHHVDFFPYWYEPAEDQALPASVAVKSLKFETKDDDDDDEVMEVEPEKEDDMDVVEVDEPVVEGTTDKEPIIEQSLAEEVKGAPEQAPVEQPTESMDVEESVADEAAKVEEPAIDEPLVEEPMVQETANETEELVVEEPLAQETATEAEEPMVEEVAEAEQPIVEPSTDLEAMESAEQAAEEPIVDEPTTVEPIRDKPDAKESEEEATGAEATSQEEKLEQDSADFAQAIDDTQLAAASTETEDEEKKDVVETAESTDTIEGVIDDVVEAAQGKETEVPVEDALGAERPEEPIVDDTEEIVIDEATKPSSEDGAVDVESIERVEPIAEPATETYEATEPSPVEKPLTEPLEAQEAVLITSPEATLESVAALPSSTEELDKADKHSDAVISVPAAETNMMASTAFQETGDMNDDTPQSPKEAQVQESADETLASIVDEAIRAADSDSMLLSEIEDSRVETELLTDGLESSLEEPPTVSNDSQTTEKEPPTVPNDSQTTEKESTEVSAVEDSAELEPDAPVDILIVDDEEDPLQIDAEASQVSAVPTDLPVEQKAQAVGAYLSRADGLLKEGEALTARFSALADDSPPAVVNQLYMHLSDLLFIVIKSKKKGALKEDIDKLNTLTAQLQGQIEMMDARTKKGGRRRSAPSKEIVPTPSPKKRKRQSYDGKGKNAARYEEQWMEKLEALKAYKAQNGNCKVPFKYDEDMSLGYVSGAIGVDG